VIYTQRRKWKKISTGVQSSGRALSGRLQNSIKEVDKVSFGSDKTPSIEEGNEELEEAVVKGCDKGGCFVMFD
jgi:hypothetical protein